MSCGRVPCEDPLAEEQPKRRWWGPAIVVIAALFFLWLRIGTQRPQFTVKTPWMALLIVASVALLV